MFEMNPTAFVNMQNRLFCLIPNESDKLACFPWGNRATSPCFADPRPITAYAACQGHDGALHIVLCTTSRHVVYASTTDGNHFARQTLSVADQPGVEVSSLAVGAWEGELCLGYVVRSTKPGRGDTLVCYQRPARGEWSGRQLAHIPPGEEAEVVFMRTNAHETALYVLHHRPEGSQALRYDPNAGGQPRLLAAGNGRITAFQRVRNDHGEDASAWLLGGQAFLNGLPLTACKNCSQLCLDKNHGGVTLSWTEPSGLLQIAEGEGWVPQNPAMSAAPMQESVILRPGLVTRRFETTPGHPALAAHAPHFAADEPTPLSFARLRPQQEEPPLFRDQAQELARLTAQAGELSRQAGQLDELRRELQGLQLYVAELEAKLRGT